jgi:type I restriction enzyme S subunit
MGKYKSYTGYKNSGVEWLGDVPEHWDVCQLKQWLLRNGS